MLIQDSAKCFQGFEFLNLIVKKLNWEEFSFAKQGTGAGTVPDFRDLSQGLSVEKQRTGA